mgnify:FL=1
MSSVSRKLRRSKAKKAQKEMQATLGLFEKIPDKCLTCEEKFDKTNKEHVNTWSVVVRKKEEKVNLYCPQCWANAKEFINQLKEQIGEADV